jgi:hypothetical protein
MSDNTERAVPEGTPANTRSESAAETNPQSKSNPVADSPNKDPGSMIDPTEALKRELEKNRLPAGVKEQILAELPSLEEHERLYRELRDKGGLSSEEYFASLGIEVPPPP